LRLEAADLAASLPTASEVVKVQILESKGALVEDRSVIPLDEEVLAQAVMRSGQLNPVALVQPSTHCRGTLGPTRAEVEDQEVQTCQGRILTSFSALEDRPLSP